MRDLTKAEKWVKTMLNWLTEDHKHKSQIKDENSRKAQPVVEDGKEKIIDSW